MNSFILKIIACITMFIDHSRYLLPTRPMFMSYIGRLAFPIFAFQAVEGYAHTKNFPKYILRLLIFAIISQIPYYLYLGKTTPNVMFTLAIGLLCIYIYDLLKDCKLAFLPIFIPVIILAHKINTDYSYYGIIIMLIFYIFKNKKIIMTISFIIITIVFFITYYKLYYINILAINPQIIMLIICTLTAIIPCLLYNGKQGPKIKYLFYLFYPLHLAFLFLLTKF